ncbi:hypothetical protein ACFVJ5_30705 [Nocardia sp. NPDC127606]|uniref:hypothetical protein n=1 Tax=Nocardia sp. NPDC127606 TaxID=3345406 RepID=UPI00363FAB45
MSKLTTFAGTTKCLSSKAFSPTAVDEPIRVGNAAAVRRKPMRRGAASSRRRLHHTVHRQRGDEHRAGTRRDGRVSDVHRRRGHQYQDRGPLPTTPFDDLGQDMMSLSGRLRLQDRTFALSACGRVGVDTSYETVDVDTSLVSATDRIDYWTAHSQTNQGDMRLGFASPQQFTGSMRVHRSRPSVGTPPIAWGQGRFLLDDGRWAPNGRFVISKRLSGPTGQIDQRHTFEDAYRWLIDEVDICEKTSQGYRFGGLIHFGTKYSTSTHLPSEIELAFDESTDQLIHASRANVVSRVVSRSAGEELRLVPVEVALAELVAQAVLDPPPNDWR